MKTLQEALDRLNLEGPPPCPSCKQANWGPLVVCSPNRARFRCRICGRMMSHNFDESELP